MPETTVIYVDETGAPAVAIIARRGAENAVIAANAAADRAEAALGGVIPTPASPEITTEATAILGGPVNDVYTITLAPPEATGTPTPLVLLASLTVDGVPALEQLVDLNIDVTGSAEERNVEAEWIVYNGVAPQAISSVSVVLPAIFDEPEITPVSVTDPGSFDPANPVEGEAITLIPPQYEGTEPVAVDLTAATINGSPVTVESDDRTILAASAVPGVLSTTWALTGPENTVTDTVTVEIAEAPEEIVPASIATSGSFDPAEPVEGQDVTLIPPEVEGTSPITIELESVEIDGSPVPTQNNGGTLSILGASVSPGALIAVWRATGPGDGNTVTDTVEATVAAIPITDIPAVLATGTRTHAVESGTNPPALVHIRYISPPEGGFVEGTKVWKTETGTGPICDAVYYADGTCGSTLYWLNAGTPSANEFQYFGGAPMVHGDQGIDITVAEAGGIYRTYHSRNGGDFVQGPTTDVVPADVVFPIYGQAQQFFDGKAAISQGVFLWGRDTIPAELADVTALNAAKAKLIQSDGQRASIADIGSVLGTPTYAAYGNAAAHAATTNPGTATGAVTVTGTFANYAGPAPYAPTITESDDMELAITTGPEADKPIMVIQASWTSMPGSTLNNTYAWRSTALGGTSTLRWDGNPLAVSVMRYEMADTTTGSKNLFGGALAAAGVFTPALVVVEVGVSARFYTATGDGSLALVRTEPMTDAVKIPTVGDMILLARYRLIRTSGQAVYTLDALPAGFDPVADAASFFTAEGHVADPAVTDAYLGSAALLDTRGNTAAENAAGLNRGTGADFTVLGDGGFTNAAAGGGAGTLVATSDSDAALLDGTAANYSLTQAVVESFGTGDYDYSGISLTVDRDSVVAGEAVYLKIEGLTDEQAAIWGFLWEFDTSGEFRYLSDLPWHMRQKSRATGHHQTAAWDTPGTKTVTVHIVPPVWLNLKGKTLTKNVGNRDPEVEFAGATWVVDPTGTGNGAPAGATVVSTYAAAHAGMSGINRGRVLFRRGQSYPLSADDPIGAVSRDYVGGVMLGAWGPETDGLAKIDISIKGFNWDRPEMCPFTLVKDLEFVGAYDVLLGNVDDAQNAWRIAENSYWTFNNCKASKIHTFIITINQNDLIDNQVAVWDSHVTDWHHYGIFVESPEKVLLRGSSVCQNPDAPAVSDGTGGTPPNYPNHGPLRLTRGSGVADAGVKVVCSQSRLFSNHGWGVAGINTDGSGVNPVAHQGVLRLGTLSSENMNVLLSELYTEGGPYTLGGGNTGYTVGSGFLAMHGCYHIGAANYCNVTFGMTGAWAHDNILVIPDTPRETTTKFSWGGFGAPLTEDSSHTASWATKPVNVFNNTVAWMLSPANTFVHSSSGTGSPNADVEYGDILANSQAATATTPEVNVVNNTLWAPNTTMVGEAAPRVPDGIHSAGVFGPAPLYRGKHFMNAAGELEFNPNYATPATAPILPLLSVTSALVDTGDTTFTGALDFFGRVITELPTPGAVAPKVLKAA